MRFFDIAVEIRLKIYSQLALSELIVFVADYGPPSPPPLSEPVLLRINTVRCKTAFYI
jgi:hypothetical protein